MVDFKIRGQVSNKTKTELEAYIKLMEQQRASWESIFLNAELSGNKNLMYDTFINMINYNMVDYGDYRLCEKNSYKTVNGERIKVKEKYKGFDGNTVTKKPSYNPKTDSYIGLWVFGNLVNKTGMLVKTYQHWGIRSEKGHEAPIVFPENTWPIEISLIDNAAKAERTARELANLMESNGKKVTDIDRNDLENIFRIGFQRLYTIRCDKWATYDQNIGYIRMFYDFKNDTVNAMVHINWKVVIRKFMDIRAFVKELKRVLSEDLHDYNIIIDQTWAEQALSKQQEVIDKNNKFAAKRDGVGTIQTL